MRYRLLVLAALLLMALPGCVYFNTFYNAQKFYRQAEKARRLDEENQEQAGTAGRKRKRDAVKASELYDKAARAASRVLEQYKESDRVDDAMFLLGRAFYWQGDYTSAIRTFGDLEQYFPNSEFYDQARYWHAQSFQAQGSAFEARELYRSLFNDRRGEVAVLAGQRLGEMAFADEDYVAAAQEYRAVLEAFPESPLRAELWQRVGESILARSDSSAYAEALAAFDQALAARPSPEVGYRARLSQGKVLSAQGQEGEALAVYTSLLKEQRFRRVEGQTRLLIGQHYQEQGQYERALEEYGRVRDDFPQSVHSAMALYYTGMLYFSHYGDKERAREYLQEVNKEKAGSEAAELSAQRLQDLGELDKIMARLFRADSLAAAEAAKVPPAADSAKVAPADPLAQVAPSGRVKDDTVIVDTPEMAPPPDTAAVLAESLSTAGLLPVVPPDSVRSLAADSVAGPPPADPARARADSTRLADFFAVAEIYRSKLVQPDSARHYYEEIAAGFPDAPQQPRVLYSLAWVEREMNRDPDAARPYLERLIAAYPLSEHANAARRLLGLPEELSLEEQAAARFAQLEDERLAAGSPPAVYLPQLDSLEHQFPGTAAGARAAYLAAWTAENLQGDTTAAAERYARVLVEHPGSEFARLAEARRKAREDGATEKLERGLKALARGLAPGERLRVIAVEPDSSDSLSLARRYLGFGMRAHQRGDLQTARQQYELALEQQQRLGEAVYRMGRILAEEGYFDDATEYYRKARAYDPGSVRVCYGLLSAYTAAGMEDSANHYLREVARRDRRNPQVEKLLEQYPTLSGAEPENLDRRSLEELELAPEDDWKLSADFLGLGDLPVVREAAAPKYPEAVTDSVQVILDVLVAKDGNPEQVEVYRGEPPFSEAALEAGRKYTFFPAVDKNDREVATWVEVVVSFVPPPKPPEVAAGDQTEPAAPAPDSSSVE
ncbi:MAG: tetratricopeptide repeat protein [Candidatus Latescibacteria bacterium]|nr:tetratricopeptide repeat protein [Candidatus Latescibacterota bacterium]